MECFRDTVGVRYCQQATPAFNYYINYLPGISLKSMDKIANAEQKNFLGVWNDIQERAIVEMENRFLNHFTSYFKTDLNNQNVVVGMFEDLTPDTATNALKGIYIEGSLYRYYMLQLRTFRFYSSADVTGAEFYIYDANNGTLLRTITVDLVQGFNDIELGFTEYNNLHDYERLFLCYDDNNFTSVVTQSKYLDGWGGLPCDPFSVSGYRVFGKGAYVPIGSAVTDINIINSDSTFGMSLQYNVNCSLDAFVCSIKNRFKHAWIQLLGAELMNERMNSDRLNRYTVDLSEEQMMDIYTKYYEEFERSLKAVFDNLNIPDDGCFECNTAMYSTHLRP